MTDLIKAAAMALDAIQTYAPDYMHGLPKEEYVTALRAALAEPVQEPVAWQCSVCGGGTLLCLHNQTDVPLYAEPPRRKPLTDEDIELHFDTFATGGLKGFARAIERAHGIGDTNA